MEPCEPTTARDEERAECTRGGGGQPRRGRDEGRGPRGGRRGSIHIVNIRSSSAGSEGSRARQTGRRGSRLGVAADAYTAAAQLSSSRGFGALSRSTCRAALHVACDDSDDSH